MVEGNFLPADNRLVVVVSLEQLLQFPLVFQ